MRVGTTYFGNHQHRDAGAFQIYFKFVYVFSYVTRRGGLAISTGVYDSYASSHWKNYYHSTISKNSLLIYAPSEPQNSNAGVNVGQQMTFSGIYIFHSVYVTIRPHRIV